MDPAHDKGCQATGPFTIAYNAFGGDEVYGVSTGDQATVSLLALRDDPPAA